MGAPPAQVQHRKLDGLLMADQDLPCFMSLTSTRPENELLPEIEAFTALLQHQGIHAALEYLNYRTTLASN
jgi:hypothetical protein